MRKTKASLYEYSLEYHWELMNDGGDLQLVIMEYSPNPDEPPDIIKQCAARNLEEAKYEVMKLLTVGLVDLMRAHIKFEHSS